MVSKRTGIIFSNADCGWLLEAGSNNYVVHVNFTFVDVEDSVSGCPYDYLKVFDGTSR